MLNQGKNAGNPVGLPSILTQGERESACIKHGSDSLYHPKEEDQSPLTYEQISGAEAKALMDSESGYIIIDARTQEEYDGGHIAGAIMIPEYEISERAEKELPDKDQLILVYCRSGRRSKIAAEELVKLGYTNVKEFGGIIDWQYEIVQ